MEEGKIEVRAVSPRAGVLNEEQFAQLKLQLAEMLTPKAPAELPYFGELVDEWLARIRRERVLPRNDEWLAGLLRPLFVETEESLTAAVARAHLEGLRVTYGAKTINKVRSAAKLTVELARESRRWSGPNPFGFVRREREPRRAYELLTLEEAGRVQRHLRRDRAVAFRVAIHLGLRPGELFALRVEDLDFVGGSIRVARSHEREETKTGEARVVPMLRAIAGDLLELARAAGKQGLLFPGTDGALMRRDTKLSRTLQVAMGEAGVGIVAVTYKCRRSGCGWSERLEASSVDKQRNCPKCCFRLWPVTEVRPVRWYDLRHCAATLHREHGADPVAISHLLGHSRRGPSTTENVYTHLDLERLHRELGRWSLPALG